MEAPHYLEVAKKAASVGGEIVARYFREGVDIRSKESSEDAHDLVTDADVESEKAVAEYILEAFPDHQVLGEETYSARSDSERLWVIDPLDGTTNFAHGIPHFAVSIAYYENGVGKCGVVYNPIRNDWFWAERGQGAWYNDAPMQAAQETGLDQVLIGVGFYYDRGAMMEATLAALSELFQQQIHGIRRFGTASLDLCQVANAHFGAFFEFELSSWDFAAGAIIVEEAGGCISNCVGEPLPLEKTSVLAAGKNLHPRMVEILSKHLPKT